MEFPNNFLILLEKGIFPRGESNQRGFPIFASVYFAAVERVFLDKDGNGFPNKFLRIFVNRNPLLAFRTSSKVN